MAQTTLPKDANNVAIQTMAPTTPNVVAVGVGSLRTGADFGDGVKVVELRPTVACFIKFGTSSVTALADGTDSFYLHAGERVTYHVGEHTRVAVIQDSTAGNLFVTELL